MVKRFFLLIVIASYTQNIMPMLNVIPRLNVFVCCFSLGCTIPEEHECVSLDLCCVGVALGCPCKTNVVTPTQQNNKNHVVLPKDNGHAILHHSIDVSRQENCTAVVGVEPYCTRNIALTNNITTGMIEKSLHKKATQNMVAHSYAAKKSNGFSYSYSYHSEKIETPNSYSKRIVEQVTTPYENTERNSAVVLINDPDQQTPFGAQYHSSASGGPIITEID